MVLFVFVLLSWLRCSCSYVLLCVTVFLLVDVVIVRVIGLVIVSAGVRWYCSLVGVIVRVLVLVIAHAIIRCSCY